MDNLKGFVREVQDKELREYLEFRYLGKPRESDNLDRLHRDILLRQALEGHRKRK